MPRLAIAASVRSLCGCVRTTCQSVPHLCSGHPRRGAPVRRVHRHPPPLDTCLAAVTYAYPWSGLVADFKFRQHPGWAHSFAQLLRATPWVEPALDAADMLIPMPLSRQRLQERGYNQARVLAHALDRTKLADGVLLRMLDTPAQRTLPRSERLRAVQHAFAVDPLQVGRLAQRRIVLLDDVMTSGASLHAAARVLRAAGAVHVTALVLARTE